MDKITKYRDCVKKLLTSYTNDDVSDNQVEVQLILDTAKRSLSVDECRLARIKSYLSMRDAFRY